MKGFCIDCKEIIDETEQVTGRCHNCTSIKNFKELVVKLAENEKKFGELVDNVAIPFNLHKFVKEISNCYESLITGLENWM